MKKAIIVLSILLVILLVVAGVLYFTDGLQNHEQTPVTNVPTIESSSASEESSETETMVPSQPTLTAKEPPVVLGGKQVETFFSDDKELYISTEVFADAAGLTVESTEPLKMTGKDDTLAYEKGVLTVNGATAAVKELYVDETLYLTFYDLVKAFGYPELTDDKSGISYYTPEARRFEIPANVNVPVLMYHAVSDDLWGIGELFVSPSSMEEQLAYLVDNGYDAIWFEDLKHVQDYKKPVLLTFDDGYDDNYTQLFPLLKKYNVKATIFVIGDAPGTPHKATSEQIREMSDSGLVSIQSHSYTHADLDSLGYDDTVNELSWSKTVITRITGKEPYVLCYPSGKFNDYTLQVGPEYYQFGIKMTGGLYNTSADPFLVNRYYIARYTDIGTFAAYISSAGT